MGHARRYAQRMDLAATTPQDALASTKFCLANHNSEYLVYLPEGDEVELDLGGTPSIFEVEWMHPVEGTITPGGVVKGGRKQTLFVPFPGPAVLYVKAEGVRKP